MVYLFVGGEGDELTTMVCVGLVSNEMKEVVDFEDEDDEVGLKDCCSH